VIPWLALLAATFPDERVEPAADRFADWPEPLRCESVTAAESSAAREEVYEWAAELYEDPQRAHEANWRTYQERRRKWERSGRAAGEPAPLKPRPATWEECLAKSRQIRIKRERDATFYDDSTNPYV
jgi:hypothetical protein